MKDGALDALAVGGASGTSLLVFQLLGKVPFNSDQGIISLMALDILERGAHPVFCYGSEYGGTLEAHYLALAFGLFGPSPGVFRVAMGFVTVLIAIAVWGVTRVAFGRRAALIGGLYVALGPPYLLYKFLTSDGGYASLELAGALALLALLVAEVRLRTDQTVWAPLAAYGFFMGIAWWILPLTASLIAASAIAVLVAVRRIPPIGSLAVAALAALTGAFPWIYHNARTGWLSLKAPEMGLANAAEIWANLRGLLRLGWPIALGSWHVWRPGTAPWPAIVIAAGLLGLFIGFAARRALRERSGPGLFALVLLCGISLVPALLSVLARRTDFVEPRYLLLSYLGVAPLCGLLVDSIWNRPVPRAVLLSVLFVLGPVSQVSAPALVAQEREKLGTEASDILARLEGRNARRTYASYWVAYRLTFLSRDGLVLSPFGSGTNGAVRSQRLAREVDEAPDPAFLLYGQDRELFDSYLATNSIPFEATEIGKLRLYQRLPPALVERLRVCRSVPFGLRPGDIEWGTPAGPLVIPAGASAEWETPLSVRWTRRLPLGLHLSYHWERLDGSVAVYDGLRSELPPRAVKGPWPVRVRTNVLANVPPGEYRLRFDLVHEGWFWFADLGLTSPSIFVQVTDDEPNARTPLPL